MNIRKIVTYNNLRKQFTAEELAFADALYAASDTERELLVESLQPEKAGGKKKAVKKGATGGTCGHEFPNGSRCDMPLSHAFHRKDSEDALAHKFVPVRGKSQRASNMAATLGKNRQPQEPRRVACYEVLEHTNHGTDKGQHQFETSLAARVNPILDKYNAKCVFEIDGKVCHGAQDDSIHDPTMGYGGFHEFVAPQVAAAGGD